jgi:hypothetical protein
VSAHKVFDRMPIRCCVHDQMLFLP